MNMKKRKRRTIALLLALLVGVTGLKQAAYAEESSPTYYDANDYFSFKNAVKEAKDGDIILIMGSVVVQADFELGSEEKSLIIKRSSAQSTISFSGGGNQVTVENITFDGGGYKASSPFVSVSPHTSVFTNCIFQNCGDSSQYLSCNSIGGAVRVDSGTNQFIGCQFKNNVGMVGGHMVIYDGIVQITDCIFTGGIVMSNGGAICVTGDTAQCIINSSVITGNQAGDFGGGISNIGKLTIEDSMIYDNIATNGGADIANKIFGTIELKDTIEQLAELFEPENILPVAWVCDYDFEESIYIPDVDPNQENALLKLQYEIIPDDSEEETESTEPGTEEGTESTDPNEPSTEQPTTPPDEDETTETPTDPSEPEENDPDDTEDTEEPTTPTEPGTDAPDDSEQDTTPGDSEPSQPVGDTNTDNSTQTDNSNNSVNTDNSDNSTHTDNSDNSSVDNSSVDNSVTNNDSSSSSITSNNTVDNSSVDNSKVDNSNVSNSSDLSTTTTNTTTQPIITIQQNQISHPVRPLHNLL